MHVGVQYGFRSGAEILGLKHPFLAQGWIQKYVPHIPRPFEGNQGAKYNLTQPERCLHIFLLALILFFIYLFVCLF